MGRNRNINRAVGWFLAIILLLMPLATVAGCKGERQGEVTADGMARPVSCNSPLTVQLRNQSTGRVSQWWWFFGDGQSSREENPSHTYAQDGVSNDTLAVITPDN